MIICIFCS